MKPADSEHLGEDKLEAYAMAQLADAELANVEEHLLVCSTCIDRLEEIEGFTTAMQHAAQRIRSEEAQVPAREGFLERIRNWTPSPIPILGGALAVAALVLMVGINVEQKPGAPVDVELIAVRGTTFGTAEAGHALHLRMDSKGISDAPMWRVEIVNDTGGRVWNGTGTSTADGILAAADRSFKPGTYFVRLLDGSGETAREYQLVIDKRKP